MRQSIEVVCAGIIVADHVCTPIARLPAAGELILAERLMLTLGGCAANVAVDLSKMEGKAAVVGRVGDDIFGRVVSEMLKEAHVDASGILVTANCDTSQTLIVNVQNEDRRFIHSFGANAEFRAQDIPRDLVRNCQVLYLGGYLLMDKLQQSELLPIFAAARESGAKTVLDVVTPGPVHYLLKLERLLPFVDVFMPNELEGQLITGEPDPLKQAEIFRKLGVGTAIVTLGSGGAVVVSEEGRFRSATYQVPFVDGSGGGDAFAAGYIYGLLKQMAAEDCLRYASALGASCVRAIGTTTGVFKKSECEAFVREHSLKIEKI
jgi:sugar/nucleoside kinase (ribokinase family)